MTVVESSEPEAEISFAVAEESVDVVLVMVAVTVVV